MRRVFFICTAILSGSLLVFGLSSLAQEPKEKDADEPMPTDAPKSTTLAKNPKPLSKEIKNGIDFLIKQQNADGSWPGGPGKPLAFMNPGKPGANENQTDVACTSIAALALMRAGYSPKQGPNAGNIKRAINQVLKAVEESDKDSLKIVSDNNRTQIQMKIGDSVDTYVAAIMLATAKGSMPDAAGEARLVKALKKIVFKMERNQNDDGTWNGAGWAPVLSQALASRAMNMAKQAGLRVDGVKLEKTAKNARESFKQFAEGEVNNGGGVGIKKGGKGRGEMMGVGTAGIGLYGAAAAISAMQDAVNTHRVLSSSSQSVLRSPDAPANSIEGAKSQLARLNDHQKALQEALRVMAKKSQESSFVQGFGSDGGEEFIAFALITEAFRANQMKEFPDWEKSMTNRLVNSQNADGSWSGKHCITGEAFCTATALLTMMSDRALQPVASQIASQTTAVKPAPPKPADVIRADIGEPKKTDVAVALPEVNYADLVRELLKDEGDRQDAIAKLRDGKGSAYTDALASAAAKLSGDWQKEVRAALAQRLTRMKATTLRNMLGESDVEIRRAAAYACAMKDERTLIPDLIGLLSDEEPMVCLAGRTALKNLSGQDFGPAEDATKSDKTKAILAWKDWWGRQSR